MKILINHGNEPRVALVGDINELSDFNTIPIEGSELHLDGYEVARINSVGVKKWIQFFDRLQSRNIKVFFYRVSTALMGQFNFIRNFGCGGSVVSVIVPFQCTHCGHLSLEEMQKDGVLEFHATPQLLDCKKCGEKTLQFDDDIDSYFKFLI